MDVEASTAVRQAEVTACKRMIVRVPDRFGVWPERLPFYLEPVGSHSLFDSQNDRQSAAPLVKFHASRLPKR